MNKQITLEEAVAKVHDGMTIMFAGFLGVGSAVQIIDAIVEKGVKDLTIIANDTAYDNVAHGKLVANHQVKKAIVSHTGTNKETAAQKNAAISERDRFIKSAEIQEIKRLRITGCTLVYKGNKLQEKELMDKVAQSKFFASAEIKDRQQPADLNLTGFEIYLSLKEPIKK